MMQRRYVTTDVFTEQLFGGNPLAVILDAGGLSSAQMQAIAREFNYAETTFVLPPAAAAHTAQVRIFTPRVEVPFAGHPNVGTAFMLAREQQRSGVAPVERFVFEEAAGLVPMTLLREHGVLVGAELRAPETLSRRGAVAPEAAAALLSLPVTDVALTTHAPQVVSVGLPFLVIEVRSREALRRARGDVAAHERLLPLDGADCVFAYVRESATALQARMFAPLDGVPEDPATGSATAATIALLAALEPAPRRALSWRVHQGADMGRPSLLLGRTVPGADGVPAVYVSGHCVPVLAGSFEL